MKLSRRTFLKALGLGAAALPIIAKAKPTIDKDPIIKIGRKEITPWTQATPEEILSDVDEAFKNAFSAATNIPKNRLFPEEPPQHSNCRCETVELAHAKCLDNWANITGVCRKPYETDNELRKRVLNKRLNKK